jgi:hypothetical protein
MTKFQWRDVLLAMVCFILLNVLANYVFSYPRWEERSESYGDSGGANHASVLLHEGWEPYAVAMESNRDGKATSVVHFRRHTW